MTKNGLRKRVLTLGLVMTSSLMASSAWAQVGMPGGVGGPPPGGGNSKPKAQPDQPETHAASGAEEASPIQTQEPTLPQDPLEIPDKVAAQIGSSAAAIPKLTEEKIERQFYGLWYSEKSKDRQFRTLFPVYADWQKKDDRSSLYGMFYYRRRAPNIETDVLFPLYWRFKEQHTSTTVVGPFIHQEREATAKSPARHTNWLPPLFFEGRNGNNGYLHIPPLLTFTKHTDHNGLNVIGPMFCRWKGGSVCDSRTADDIDMGMAPLYFYGRNESTEYEIIPPLLHYYRYYDAGESYTNVWGPYIRTHDKEGDSRHIAPFYWHWWGKNRESLTVAPFFHYGYEGNAKRFITPLFYWANNPDKNERTFASWVYAHHKGRTELEMISPLYWHYQDPDTGLDRKLLFPFVYKEESPRGKDLVVFPFYGRFHRYGLSDDTWITPLFRYHKDTAGWQANLFPFFHVGRTYNSTHLVLAPFVWDFASPQSRVTIVLPGFFRFADKDGVSQLALNTFYRERKVPGGTDWEFHFFPVVSFGSSPIGHWWKVLYGLAGYTREGAMSKMQLFYVPITLSKPRPTE